MTKKKPFMIKCPATLIALNHKKYEINRHMSELEKLFVPGKRLFIEFMGAPYNFVCKTALSHGIKEIINLYESKTEWVAEKLMLKNIIEHTPVEMKFLYTTNMTVDSYLRTLRFYGMGDLRERKWLLKLREAREGDIIIMNPQHAYRMAPLLGISRNKVVWLSHSTKVELKKYRLALTARKRRIMKGVHARVREERKSKKIRA